MKYVDWVEQVLRAAMIVFDAGDGFATSERAIAGQLGLNPDDDAVSSAFDHAIPELGRLGLLIVVDRTEIRPTQEGRRAAAEGLRTIWAGLPRSYLDSQQSDFLAKLCELTEQRRADFADVVPVEGDDVLVALGQAPDRGDAYNVIAALSSVGLVDDSEMGMGTFPVVPTYAGLVMATEIVASDAQALVLRLLADWETTNVDFKRDLHLDSNDDKAEFVRDVLALGDTQVTGSRYLVTGFDDKTRQFTTTVDPKVTANRIEDVLNAYTIPPVTVRYVTFPWIDGTGDVGLLEVIRDRTKVPYRVAKNLAGSKHRISKGQVFVRHNSHVAEATPQEVADLEAEAQWAKTHP